MRVSYDYVDTYIKVLDQEYDKVMSGYYNGVERDGDGCLVKGSEGDDADGVVSVLEELKEELRDLGIPLDALECKIVYHSREYLAEEDALTIEMTIRNGEIAEYKESRTVMVDVEPRFVFDMSESR